jgi:hypothetical protein
VLGLKRLKRDGGGDISVVGCATGTFRCSVFTPTWLGDSGGSASHRWRCAFICHTTCWSLAYSCKQLDLVVYTCWSWRFILRVRCYTSATTILEQKTMGIIQPAAAACPAYNFRSRWQQQQSWSYRQQQPAAAVWPHAYNPFPLPAKQTCAIAGNLYFYVPTFSAMEHAMELELELETTERLRLVTTQPFWSWSWSWSQRRMRHIMTTPPFAGAGAGVELKIVND